MKLMKNNKRTFINSALLDDNVGRIEMYGDVYDEIPVDFWTGQPITDQAITLKDVKSTLEGLKDCSRLEIHLSSYGGDATVGLTIHNLLKGMNKHITCVIDGIAASAAFTIASACDDVQVYPGSLMMCHKVMSFLCGYYNVDELNKIINGNEAYDKASAAVYAQKTGMTETQCLNLMKAETWMTGKQAIEYGFANTMLDGNADVKLINKTTMKVNGIEQNIKALNIPEEILNSINTDLGGNDVSKVEEFMNYMASFFSNKKAEAQEEEEKEEEKEQAVEEEKEEEKEQAEEEKEQAEEEKEEEKEDAINLELVNSAKEEERKRIQEIEAIANTIDADLVNEAKFGATACNAQELSLRAKQRETEKRENALKDMQADSEASKVNEIESAPGEIETPESAEKLTEEQIKNEVKRLFNSVKAKEEK